jgi:uncharacterized protein involved in exopolysaccharide biosynthesis
MMSSHSSSPGDDHLADGASQSSSPVPEKWVPWVIIALVVGLIFVGFAIPAGTLR